MMKLLSALLLAVTIFGWGGYIEGRFFPVVAPMRITELVPGTEYDDDQGIVPFVDLYFQIEKLRDCQLARITFRRTSGSTITYREPDVKGGSRATGKHGIGPYRLYGVSPFAVRRMRAFVSHDCIGRPWTTYTDFSPMPVKGASMAPFLFMAVAREWLDISAQAADARGWPSLR